MTQRQLDLWLIGGAAFSADQRYRWHLSRSWSPERGRCCFVMLNPSTADELQDDPTIRRCIGFARAWGYGALDVVNIFAFRSTDPEQLYREEDPIGGLDNDAAILRVARSAARVVCAWGAHGELKGRGFAVAQLLRGAGVSPLCFGLTKSGQPLHPLYQPAAAEPRPFLLPGERLPP